MPSNSPFRRRSSVTSGLFGSTPLPAWWMGTEAPAARRSGPSGREHVDGGALHLGRAAGGACRGAVARRQGERHRRPVLLPTCRAAVEKPSPPNKRTGGTDGCCESRSRALDSALLGSRTASRHFAILDNEEFSPVSHVPDLVIEQRQDHPAAWIRGLPDRPGGDRRGGAGRRSTSAIGTSTRRRCTATRRVSARASVPPGIDRGDVFVTSKLNNGFHRPDDARRPSTTPWRRSASTTSTCS